MKSRTASWLDKSLAAAPLVVLGARNADFPDKALWTSANDHLPWLVPALLVMSVIFTLGPFAASAQQGLIERRNHVQRRVLIRLGEMIRAVNVKAAALQNDAEGRPLSVNAFRLEDLGLHIWQMKRRWWQVKPRLQRIATYRLGGGPSLTDFQPGKGKGVVGICWRENQPFACDVRSIAGRITAETDLQNIPEKQVFEKMREADPDSVMGFDWEEFKRYRHRGSVFAAPIQGNGEKFLGCLSFDAEEDHFLLEDAGVGKELVKLASELRGTPFDEM